MKLKEGGKIYIHMYLVVCSDPPTSGSAQVFCSKKIRLGWEGEIRHKKIKSLLLPTPPPTTPLDSSPPIPSRRKSQLQRRGNS